MYAGPDESVGVEMPAPRDTSDSIANEEKSEVEFLVKSDGSNNTTNASVKPVGFFELFRFADKFDWLLMFVGTIGALVVGASFPLFSVVFGDLLDELAAQGENKVESKISEYALKLLILGIIAMVGAFIQIKCWNHAAIRQISVIRKKYLQSALSQEMGWFDGEVSGSLASELMGDSKLMQDGMGDKVGSVIQCVTNTIVGLILGFYYGWQLALVTVSSIPAIAIAGAFFGKFASDAVTKAQEAYAEAGYIAEEVIGSVRTVQAYGSQNFEHSRYLQKLKECEKMGIRNGRMTGLVHGITFAVMFLSYALSFWYGAKLIIESYVNPNTGKAYTGGDVITVFFSILIGSFSLGNAGPFVSAITNGRGAAVNIFKVIDRKPLILDGNSEGQKIESRTGKIVFNKVNFAYPSRKDVPILQEFNLRIRSGQIVALVGESGAGKSTITALLERFYDPVSGSIEIDGIDISKLKLEDLRNMIAIVPQQPCLLSGTIEDNIRMGNSNYSIQEIHHAAKLANAHDFIMRLADGYNTSVGQSGSELLSGGQIQRIAIARAVIRKPVILLLDEATSALDNESELIVQKALENVVSSQTTIIIAHRLSTIRNAEQIHVLKNGVVVESGTHNDLLSIHNGHYSMLVSAQEAASATMLNEDPVVSNTIELKENDHAPEVSVSYSVEKSIRNIEEVVHGVEDIVTDAVSGSSNQSSFLKIFKLSRNEWHILLIGCFSGSFNGIVFPLFGLLVSKMITVFYMTDHEALKERIRLYCFMFIALAVGEIILTSLSKSLFSAAGEKLTTKIRSLAFRNIVDQEIAFFDDEENASGVICAKLTNDASQIRGLTVDWAYQTVQIVMMTSVGIGIAFSSDWRVSLFLFALTPLIVMAGIGQMLFIQGNASSVDEESSRIISEAMASFRLVVAFNYQDRIVSSFDFQQSKVAKFQSKSGNLFALFFGLTQFILFFIFAASFWFSGLMIKEGHSTFNGAFEAFYVLVMSFMSIGQVSQMSPDIQKAKDAVKSVFALIERKSLINPSSSDGEQISLEKSTIEFRQVEFSYPARRDMRILNSLSLDLQPGRTTAIVGTSGSGKSTLFALLERFYDVDAGAIFLNSQDIRSLNVNALRTQVALVSQDPSLFDLTIRENILYGELAKAYNVNSFDIRSPEVEKRILEVARKANIIDLIQSLPDGLDTRVGKKGSLLSGGQRQRVSIARALFKDPQLLLLDEATSALDNTSEKLIQTALSELMKGRTTLLIAHRLSTVRNADEIVVISEGKLVERGTHNSLLNEGGVYSSLVRAGSGH